MSTKQTITTCPGKAVYPKISEPDTQGQYATGKYKTYLEVPADELASFKAKINAIAKDELPKLKSPKLPFKTLKDGTEVIAMSSKYRPLVFDAKKQPIPENSPKKIGGGSTIRVVVEPYNYEKGISLRLKKVQVLELVEYGGADEFDVEDGFETDQTTTNSAREFEDEDIGI